MKSNLIQITFSAIEFTGAFIYAHWLRFIINHFMIRKWGTDLFNEIPVVDVAQ